MSKDADDAVSHQKSKHTMMLKSVAEQPDTSPLSGGAGGGAQGSHKFAAKNQLQTLTVAISCQQSKDLDPDNKLRHYHSNNERDSLDVDEMVERP